MHPILPLTRGCRRTCSFCYGAYQDRVFGRRVRVRSAEALARDLARIEADPELFFVTLFFADAVYMRSFAEGLAGRRFDLDAFLFFCGDAATETVETLRGVFGGRVVFTIIQPSDLAPLPNERPAAARQADFDGLIARVRGMERTAAAVFHVAEPPSPAVAAAQAEKNSNIVSLEAQDWAIVRPDRNALEADGGLEGQLDVVTDAARGFAASNVLRILVPALGTVANPRPLDLGSLVHLRDDPRTDPFERRMLTLLVRQILERRRYGVDALELSFAAGAAGPGEVAWVQPRHHLGGDCRWSGGLRGFGWEGEVTLPAHADAFALAPLPRVTLLGTTLDPATWPRCRLPGVTVQPGPTRAVRCGGEASEDALSLWLEDRGPRITSRLAFDMQDDFRLPGARGNRSAARGQRT